MYRSSGVRPANHLPRGEASCPRLSAAPEYLGLARCGEWLVVDPPHLRERTFLVGDELSRLSFEQPEKLLIEAPSLFAHGARLVTASHSDCSAASHRSPHVLQ